MKRLKRKTKKIVKKAALVSVAPSPSICKTLTRKAEKAVDDLELKCARGACGHPKRMHIFNGIGDECHLCPCTDFIVPE